MPWKNKENNLPLVSIVIPCRNEERLIGRCLDSIIANDYSKNRLEVLVIDGKSEDKTRDIVREYTRKYSFIRLFNNPKKITPVAMNIGIKKSHGELVLIMGAHSKINEDFILRNAESLRKYDVDCIGGISKVLPSNDTLIAQSIALVFSCPFGVGNAYYNIGVKKPIFVDTVSRGCYKREVFKKIGLFDENLVRNQDDEFNFRLIKNGGKILLVPEIVSYYYARRKLSQLWRQYFQYGYFKVRVAQKIGAIFTWRQLIPAIFVGSLILTGAMSFFSKFSLWLFLFIVVSYLFANFGFSLSIAIKKRLRLFLALPVVFATLHFSYGVGYLKGIWDFVVCKKHLKKKIEDVPVVR